MDGARVSLQLDEDQAAAELSSFARWLRNDEVLRNRYQVVQAPLEPGDMGGTISHLVLQLADPAAVSAFVVGFWQWQRNRRATITATVTGVDGRSVQLDLTGLTRDQVDEMLPALVENVRRVLDEG